MVVPSLAQARVSLQVASAVQRAAEQQLWQVVVQGHAPHTYTVPSQSRPSLRHTVLVQPIRPGQPRWAAFSCTCEAHRRAACVHRAAVWQYLVWRRTGAVPVAVHQPALPPPAQSGDTGRRICAPLGCGARYQVEPGTWSILCPTCAPVAAAEAA